MGVEAIYGTDAVLDEVTGLWRDAKELEHDAEVLESEAKDLRSRAEDTYDVAEEMWKPLIESHPEWRDAFIEQRDPRE
jgi:hypothetical protein